MHSPQILVTIAIMILASASHLRADDQRDSIGELKRFRGDWLVNGSRKNILHVELLTDRKLETRSWVLGNSGQKIGRRESMSYDVKRKSYRATISYGNGKKWEATGKWDEPSKTLTLVAPIKEGKRHFTLKFVNERKHLFTITEYDRNGKPGWTYREERFRLAD